MNVRNEVIFCGVRGEGASSFRCHMVVLHENSVFRYCYFLYVWCILVDGFYVSWQVDEIGTYDPMHDVTVVAL